MDPTIITPGNILLRNVNKTWGFIMSPFMDFGKKTVRDRFRVFKIDDVSLLRVTLCVPYGVI